MDLAGPSLPNGSAAGVFSGDRLLVSCPLGRGVPIRRFRQRKPASRYRPKERQMNQDRRTVLKGTGGVAVMGLAASAGLFKPGNAWAQTWNKAAFETKTMAD